MNKGLGLFSKDECNAGSVYGILRTYVKSFERKGKTRQQRVAARGDDAAYANADMKSINIRGMYNIILLLKEFYWSILETTIWQLA